MPIRTSPQLATLLVQIGFLNPAAQLQQVSVQSERTSGLRTSMAIGVPIIYPFRIVAEQRRGIETCSARIMDLIKLHQYGTVRNRCCRE